MLDVSTVCSSSVDPCASTCTDELTCSCRNVMSRAVISAHASALSLTIGTSSWKPSSVIFSSSEFSFMLKSCMLYLRACREGCA